MVSRHEGVPGNGSHDVSRGLERMKSGQLSNEASPRTAEGQSPSVRRSSKTAQKKLSRGASDQGEGVEQRHKPRNPRRGDAQPQADLPPIANDPPGHPCATAPRSGRAQKGSSPYLPNGSFFKQRNQSRHLMSGSLLAMRSLATPQDPGGGTMTSSPGCQFAGVATLY